MRLRALQEGRQAGDVAVGRYLADTMAVVPRFSRAEFERMFNESVQDSVMVSYLANLMRAQVCFSRGSSTSPAHLLLRALHEAAQQPLICSLYALHEAAHQLLTCSLGALHEAACQLLTRSLGASHEAARQPLASVAFVCRMRQHVECLPFVACVARGSNLLCWSFGCAAWERIRARALFLYPLLMAWMKAALIICMPQKGRRFGGEVGHQSAAHHVNPAGWQGCAGTKHEQYAERTTTSIEWITITRRHPSLSRPDC
eukprot:scaffold44443_cov21-Tisochrysis_lutea.AAC.1